jgi:predicted Zn finger-like uncharacterized protein
MILTCPNCGTQYVVKDSAIPPHGRQVRCASCKHSWHQDPEAAPEAAPQSAAAPQPGAGEAEEESIAEAAMIDPSTGPEAEERAYEEAVVAEAAEEQAPAPAEGEPVVPPAEIPVVPETPPPSPPETAATETSDFHAPPSPEVQVDDDFFSPFADRDYAEPRPRRPLLTILIVLLLVGAVAAAFWFLAPAEWKARLGLADAGATPLTLVTTHMDRQKLESGNELLTVAGRVINPTNESQSVPPIYAQLKTRAGKVIYSWTIAPPAPTLGPGASASFNSAEVNVPSGGDELTISLGAPRA